MEMDKLLLSEGVGLKWTIENFTMADEDFNQNQVHHGIFSKTG